MEGMEGSEAACRQGADAGLIAHSTNVVEHPELVAERLLRYADIVGRDSVMAGTDCRSRKARSPAACTVRSCGRSLNASPRVPLSPRSCSGTEPQALERNLGQPRGNGRMVTIIPRTPVPREVPS